MEPQQPSSLWLRVLKGFCKPQYYPDIEGDLLEIYYHRVDTQGLDFARRRLRRDVLLLFRPGIIRTFGITQKLNVMDLFKHAFLMSFRGFRRQRTTFVINLAGLSLGLAAACFMYLWVQDERSVDQFHAQSDQLYRIMEHQLLGDDIVTQNGTPGLLGQAMAEELPEVLHAVTYSWDQDETFQVKGTAIPALGIYASEDFFNVFSFDLFLGDPATAMVSPEGVCLSESLATTLFGSPEDALGSTLTISQNRQKEVTGVFRDPTGHSSLQFDFLFTFPALLTDHPWAVQWGSNPFNTVTILQPNVDIAAFNEKIEMFAIEHGGEEQVRLFAHQFDKEYLYGNWENGQQAGGRIEYVRIFSVVSGFILLIACINFINLATARVARRQKEVGVKKAIGAGRFILIFQFLFEATLLVILSLMIGLLMVGILMPEFNQITGKELSLQFTPELLKGIGLGLLAMSLVAGLYPALHFSGFKPYNVLRKTSTGSWKELWARQGLVIFQFVVSVVLIVAATVVSQQVNYTQSKNLGYNKDQLLVVDFTQTGMEQMPSFIAEAQRTGGVTGAAAIGHGLVDGGQRRSTSSMSWPGKDPELTIETEVIIVGPEMVDLLGVEITDGNSFSYYPSDSLGYIMINEAALEIMALEQPIGQQIRVWGADLEIIGVVKDFHYRSLHQQVEPQVFLYAPQYTNFTMIRYEAGREQEVLGNLEATFESLFPEAIFNYKFFDESYEAQYRTEQRVGSLANYFTGLALLISCLGLFGLASFTAERRLKEIGIRKLLGSDEWRLVGLLSSSFLKLVLVSLLISIPISYFLTNEWLAGFAFRISLQWWFFAGAAVLAVAITYFTVGLQLMRAARIKPIQCLRLE